MVGSLTLMWQPISEGRWESGQTSGTVWFIASAPGIERLVVGDNASGLRRTERQGLKVFRWDVGKNKVGICLKTKSAVVPWLAQHDAARGSTAAKEFESVAQELRTDPETPMLR